MSAFVPARSKLEAVSRISALTHSPPERLGPGSKERKSVLTNLASGLGLGVDSARPKPELGSQIADALGASWEASCWSTGDTITLVGLNRLLEGAETRLAQERAVAEHRAGRSLARGGVGHVPARSKLEVVSRISALTHSPPERLGPGSKERKSVLINLAAGLGLAVDQSKSKPKLGEQIAALLDVPWDGSCWSAGQTITLEGLNRILRGAETRVARGASGKVFRAVRDEASALLAALRDVLPRRMEGRACVAKMHDASYSQWAQDEWVGFYFEFLGLPALINTFGGGPRLVGSTRFDYALDNVWDFKVHMAHSGVAPLNDQASIATAVDAGGLGLLVLTGSVEYDDGEFRSWQREFRAERGKTARPRTSPPRYERKSKSAFTPGMVEAFFVRDAATLRAALDEGVLGVMKQGVQSSGRPRAPKYSINLVKARMSDLLLGQVVV